MMGVFYCWKHTKSLIGGHLSFIPYLENIILPRPPPSICTKPKSTHWNINFESLSKQICIISMYYQVRIHWMNSRTIFYDCTTNVTSIQQPLRQRFSKCQSNFSQYPIVCMAKIVVLNVPITMMSLSVLFLPGWIIQ